MVEQEVDIRMGTTIIPVATLADIQDLETIQHPTPTGMPALGLEHEVHGFSHSSVHVSALVLEFLSPILYLSHFETIADITYLKQH